MNLLSRSRCALSDVRLRRRLRNCAMALRDYYPFWKLRKERSPAGKLLLLDPEDEGNIQIFFDDNILHGSAHIVDVRDVHTGLPIPFQVPVTASSPRLPVLPAVQERIKDLIGKEVPPEDQLETGPVRIAWHGGLACLSKILQMGGPSPALDLFLSSKGLSVFRRGGKVERHMKSFIAQVQGWAGFFASPSCMFWAGYEFRC